MKDTNTITRETAIEFIKRTSEPVWIEDRMILKDNDVLDMMVDFAKEQLKNYRMGNIVTMLEKPPIPDRKHDWYATRENWDEGDPIGYGSTEQEAIDNLIELEND